MFRIFFIFFDFQSICYGDSGGPTIWEDTTDKRRAYLMGIIRAGSSIYGTCGKFKNNFAFSIAATVPGKILDWVTKFNYKEIKECLRAKKP